MASNIHSMDDEKQEPSYLYQTGKEAIDVLFSEISWFVNNSQVNPALKIRETTKTIAEVRKIMSVMTELEKMERSIEDGQNDDT